MFISHVGFVEFQFYFSKPFRSFPLSFRHCRREDAFRQPCSIGLVCLSSCGEQTLVERLLKK